MQLKSNQNWKKKLFQDTWKAESVFLCWLINVENPVTKWLLKCFQNLQIDYDSAHKPWPTALTYISFLVKGIGTGIGNTGFVFAWYWIDIKICAIAQRWLSFKLENVKDFQSLSKRSF